MDDELNLRVSPQAYESVFVVPSTVVDNCLRVASKTQLKVLLWIFRNGIKNIDKNRINLETGVAVDEIDDCILYWVEKGIFTKHKKEEPDEPIINHNNPIQPESTSFNNVSTVYTQKEEPKYIKPTQQQISSQIAKDKELRYLFSQIETIIGPFGYDKQANIIALYNYYGLPTNVILTLFEYAKYQGKENKMDYIMRTGKKWSIDNIDTLEKAQKQIDILGNILNRVWEKFKIETGFDAPKPTPKQVEYFQIWIEEYNFDVDMIILAYYKTVEKKAKVSFGYMNGILKSWYESGFKTPVDVENATKEFLEKRKIHSSEKSEKTTKIKGTNKDTSAKSSYDIELAMNNTNIPDPTKTKRNA